MSHIPAGPQDTHHFFQPAAPIFEMLEHTVGDYEIECAVVKREGFHNSK